MDGDVDNDGDSLMSMVRWLDGDGDGEGWLDCDGDGLQRSPYRFVTSAQRSTYRFLCTLSLTSLHSSLHTAFFVRPL